MLKNKKIKKSEIGSKVTIHRRGKSNGLNISPTTDDQNPTSQMARVSNPGGAIPLGRGGSEFGVRLLNTKGKEILKSFFRLFIYFNSFLFFMHTYPKRKV